MFLLRESSGNTSIFLLSPNKDIARLGLKSAKYNLEILPQPLNALGSIFIFSASITTTLKLVHSANASLLISLIFLGIMIDSKLEQPLNEPSGIHETKSGIETCSRFEQPEYLLLVDYQCYTL